MSVLPYLDEPLKNNIVPCEHHQRKEGFYCFLRVRALHTHTNWVSHICASLGPLVPRREYSYQPLPVRQGPKTTATEQRNKNSIFWCWLGLCKAPRHHGSFGKQFAWILSSPCNLFTQQTWSATQEREGFLRVMLYQKHSSQGSQVYAEGQIVLPLCIEIIA